MRKALWTLGAAALTACAAPSPLPTPPAPVAAPAPAPAASAESLALAARYARVEQNLLRDGLLRSDGGGVDTPFTDAMLARAFLSVAFFTEYAHGEVSSGSGATQTTLQRWEGPIRVAVRIGASVAPDEAAALRATIGSYMARLGRLTGLSIALDDRHANFYIHIGSVDERARLGAAMAGEMPGLTATQLASMTRLQGDAYCQVLSQTIGTSPVYIRAMAVIPAEHPPLLMQACLHEELAQALGLPNDSNLARPSIFNDDQEFALLTRMDEDMLRLLYSPELHPGMTEDEARPIVQRLATRLLDGQT